MCFSLTRVHFKLVPSQQENPGFHLPWAPTGEELTHRSEFPTRNGLVQMTLPSQVPEGEQRAVALPSLLHYIVEAV